MLESQLVLPVLALATFAGIAAGQSSLMERANELIGPMPAANAADRDRADLGAMLFADPRLSGSNTMSCTTCHKPNLAFTDGKARAVGANGEILPRNTPSLLNVGLQQTFGWDGRGATLEDQSLEPIVDSNEMDQDLGELAEELNGDSEYREAFERIFEGPPSKERIAHALGAYQRSLVTHDSPFDRFLRGDEDALSLSAKEGLELFLGYSECVTCHNGPALSDGRYYRLGIGLHDKGRGVISGVREDDYRFRVPSLRNIALTGPYMHDGSLETLHDVVEFYFRHSTTSGQEGLALDFEPLVGQSYSDIETIVAFLKSLSDNTISKSMRNDP